MTYIKPTAKKKSNHFLSILVLFTLQGCNSYSSSFGCPDARGLQCKPVSLVDRQINSGEIEEVELGNCKGRTCKNRKDQVKPQVGLSKIYKAQITPAKEMDSGKPVITEGAIYVK